MSRDEVRRIAAKGGRASHGAETLHQVDVADQVGHHRDHHAG